MRPERSEEVLNETRLRGSTVHLRISDEGRGTRDEGVGATCLVPRPSSLVPLRLRRKQGGFATAAAIFLIVVLALLATGMVQILTTSHTTLSQEYTSARAYMAARSGLQWGMYQAVYGGSGTATVTFSSGALGGTQASVSTSSASIDGNTFYIIDASGSYGSNSDAEYSLRHLRLRFNP